MVNIAGPIKGETTERGRTEGGWCAMGLGGYRNRASRVYNHWASDHYV